MHIQFFSSLWGMPETTLEASFKLSKEAGYDGVEMSIPLDADRRRTVQQLLAEFDLELILILHSSGATPKDHADDLTRLLGFAAELQPVLVNSQSSRDFFPIKESVRVIKQANNRAARLGLPLVHETHRARAMFSLPATLAILDAIPDLRVTADLAHLCMVHGTYMQDQIESLNRVLERCHYIHARVGHPEGGQVAEPRAPEWQQAVEYYLGWWRQIVESRRKEGVEVFPITTEFGPPEYMPTLPYTRQPVANLWEINLWMRDTLKYRLQT